MKFPSESNDPIIIIGNGISGITAAIQIRKKSNKQILVISKEGKYFFSRTALMYVYMRHMKFEHIEPYEPSFWKKNNINLMQTTVSSVYSNQKIILLDNDEEISYDSLILATGSVPNKFGWPGQDLRGVQGLYSKQDLDLLEEYSSTTKEAVIVGGGLIGIELAEMLQSRGIKVTFLVREDSFWNNVLPKEESIMINNHIKKHGVRLELNVNLAEIVSDEKGRVKEVKTDKGETIPCQFVGLTAGVRPNIDFLDRSTIEINRGVLVNEFLETNQPSVYAIGDCAEMRNPSPSRRPIEAIWYTGRMMGETVALTVTGKKTPYKPGIWFNSAKFFDIEYQIYGAVSVVPNEKEAHFYWELKGKDKAVRFSYNIKTNTIVGLSAMGIRFRHETLDTWIREERTLDYVINKLSFAQFNPEFYKSYVKKIQKEWEEK